MATWLTHCKVCFFYGTVTWIYSLYKVNSHLLNNHTTWIIRKRIWKLGRDKEGTINQKRDVAVNFEQTKWTAQTKGEALGSQSWILESWVRPPSLLIFLRPMGTSAEQQCRQWLAGRKEMSYSAECFGFHGRRTVQWLRGTRDCTCALVGSGPQQMPQLPQIRFRSTTLGKKQKKPCISCAKSDREMHLSQW